MTTGAHIRSYRFRRPPINLREKVCAAAQSWVGTPYHHMGAIKGAGADCGMTLIRSFAEAGCIEDYTPAPYAPEWCLHRDEERYLEEIQRHLVEIDVQGGHPKLMDRVKAGWQGQMGDVLVFKVGRTFSHGAIVTRWPNVVHAYFPSGMVEEVAIPHTPMADRPMRVFTFAGY